MLPKKNKIKKGYFSSDNKRKITFHSQYASISIEKKEDNKSSKFSFVVSGKISKKAVQRNKIKRRGYYVIKKFLPQIKTSYYVAFYIKKEIMNLRYDEFEKQILFLLNKAKLIN